MVGQFSTWQPAWPCLNTHTLHTSVPSPPAHTHSPYNGLWQQFSACGSLYILLVFHLGMEFGLIQDWQINIITCLDICICVCICGCSLESNHQLKSKAKRYTSFQSKRTSTNWTDDEKRIYRDKRIARTQEILQYLLPIVESSKSMKSTQMNNLVNPRANFQQHE